MAASEACVELEGILVGAGNPLLDISAEVPADFLTKYEVTPNNAILAEEKHLPVYDDLVQNFPVQYIAGGATQNSIRVAQWMLKVPNATAYFGCVGDDEFGQQMRRQAECDGVNVQYLVNPDVVTGTCAVLVNDGERSLIANLSAANHFQASHLEKAECKAVLDKAKYFYMAGFFLTVSLESIQAIGRGAVDGGKTVLMNLSAPFIIQFFWDQLQTAMPFVDVMFGNESEFATYGEKMGWGTDIATIARNLAALPKASGLRARTVVATQGKDPTIVVHNGEIFEFPVELLPKEQLVDTNGAGDAFVGGFLSQFVQKRPLAHCVEAGHWAARVIIQRSGCTYPPECTYTA